MRRPLGLFLIAILNFVTGLSHLGVFAAISLAVYLGHIGSEDLWDMRTLLPLGFFASGAALFLSAGVGLLRLKEWGRWLAVAGATLTILVLLMSFFDHMRHFYTDIMSGWRVYVSPFMLLYGFVLWPLEMVVKRFIPEFLYEAWLIGSYGLGIGVNALVVLHLQNARVKQAFTAAS